MLLLLLGKLHSYPTQDISKLMTECTVELWAARIPGLPGLVADHHWFLLRQVRDGDPHESCDRWEIWQRPCRNNTCWMHLHKNLLQPYADMGNGPSRLIKQWRGSEAEQLIEKIEASPKIYPHKSNYKYWPGPNSNTFAQWVVRDKMRLGLRAFGRLYPIPKNVG